MAVVTLVHRLPHSRLLDAPRTQWSQRDTRLVRSHPCAFGLVLGLAGGPVQHVTKSIIIGEYGGTAISTVQRQKLNGCGVHILPAGILVTITCTWVSGTQANHVQGD